MRLRFFSQRSPYLRAGLGWPARGDPVEVDLLDLDGARLRQLLDDPVLRAEYQDEAVGWTSLDVTLIELSAEEIDERINLLRPLLQEVPEVAVDPRIGELEKTLADTTDRLETAFIERDAARARADRAEADAAELRNQIEALEAKLAAPLAKPKAKAAPPQGE